jgi:malonyl-CoA decarboxylase
VSGSRLAAQTLAACAMLPEQEFDKFLDLLADEFSPDPRQVWSAAQVYHDDPSASHLLSLQRVVEPPRQELFRRLNMAPGGTALLVDLRRRLLPTIAAHPKRDGVNADLLHLFRSWFNRGFLILKRIDWHTAAAVLERLIEYEAVHQIQGWRDLRRRLERDRRCYGFFHPVLPDDPLIFIEVALTRGLPTTVQTLLDPDSPVGTPDRPHHAVFYSITNCQEGLRGVSFGNFLIKQVVEDLGGEFPSIRTFATLSPIPDFRAWLTAQQSTNRMLSAAAAKLLLAPETSTNELTGEVKEEIMALCAEYLLHAKRPDRAPLDSVARFHLANGARLERINWMGDRSPTGIRRSFGLTANYVYRRDDVEKNHEAYARGFRVVAARSLVRMAARIKNRTAR